MKLCGLIIFLFIIWLPVVIAGSFPIPLSIARTSDRPAKFKVTWTLIDIPEADLPAPAGFWIGSAASPGPTFPVVQSETCSNNICATKVIPGESISSAAMRAYRKGPSITQYPTSGGTNGACIAFGGIPQGNNAYAAALLPTGCMKQPPANVYCFIVTPEIKLDHGTIAFKDVMASKASASVKVNCSQKNDVKLSLNTKLSYIQLNNNAKANILINGKLPGERHTLPFGLSSFSITSELEGITQSGTYSGSAVLIIEPA